MDAILHRIVGLAVVTVAMFLAADVRSIPHAPAEVSVAVVGDALAETSRHGEARAAVPRETGKLPCPLCPKQTKTKLCSTAPCPPASGWLGGPVAVAFTHEGSELCLLPEDCRRKGVDPRPDLPPPKSLI